ncbi:MULTISPECIES: VOC family protein [unclassified Pantoea]|uniref:VOC family protein n=1 Tax=unclassified Pantoea TaxID=2630326 RepID=UPI001CD37D48|nr:MULTISPECIES: VOC family protein [unclassified Pantoea]MCA1176475.1 VOC family protein [Pantoea sp. alder69]MCA1253012.1 VOC family protein [Pantoea sp. alder70]MCA1264480.1 VOC family protein [Pantoea sp. alder81]
MHFPSELSDLEKDLTRFELALQQFAERLGLEWAEHEVDHIAVRCHQFATAERWKAGLQQIGQLFSEAMINGRPICLFKLHQPLSLAGRQVDVIELPWPGEKLYRHEGWEHVEIVLRGEPETLGMRAMALLSDQALTQPGISFKTSAPKGENERLPNPTLAVTDGQTTIKFHPWRLEEIVASEQG